MKGNEDSLKEKSNSKKTNKSKAVPSTRVSKKSKEIKPNHRDEIDELFAKKKDSVVLPSKEPLSKLKKKSKDDFDVRGTGKARQLTDDGLPIFTAEEMSIGKGGETNDCPFDCSCCY